MSAELLIDGIEKKEISQRERGVLDALRKVRFGSVEVIIHDGQVVQIERKEKVRFAQ